MVRESPGGTGVEVRVPVEDRPPDDVRPRLVTSA